MVDISYQGPTYRLSLFGQSSHDSEFIDYVKNIICYNQGELAQYSFLAAEFHKGMKTAFAEDDIGVALTCQSTLSEYLNRNLERIIKENFKYLHSHFKRRAKESPRICVKGGYDIAGQEIIISLFRDRNVNYKSDAPLDENTGFQYIYDTGRFYLCNDIPEKARIGAYVNPRLIPSAAKVYTNPGIIKRKLGLTKGLDSEWEKCWDGGGRGIVISDSCYKSTLIIPMTLRNNSLDDSYKEMINLSDVDRTIFGFLCIDHVNSEYFIPDVDVALGYIFADILSLYLISRMVYTNISQTYQAVSNSKPR